MIYELLKKENTALYPFTKEKELENVAKAYLGYVSKAKAEGFIYFREAIETDSDLMLEFALEDILKAENVEQLINPEGQSYPLVKIWVKKEALGKKVRFFKVGR